MAINAAHWSVDRATGNIRYIGDDHGGTAPSYATVIEFHRWLQDLADDASSSGNDELDITDENPSNRQTDNIIQLYGNYNIDDTAAEHLYDGSIIQGAEGVDRVIYDGIVNFGNPGVQIQIIQNGAVLADDWWNKNIGGSHTGAADASVLTDSTKSWTTDELVGYVIYNTTDGSKGVITENTSNTVTATLEGGTENDWDNGDTYLIGQGLNADAAQGISHRFMIKTHDFVGSGGDIDGRRLIGTSRRYGYTYSEFGINGTSRGNNVLALSDATDLNNSTDITTVDAYSDVFITRTASTATVSGVNNSGQADLVTSDGTQFTVGDFIMVAGDDQEYQVDAIVTNTLTLNRNLAVTTAGGEAIYDLGIGYRAIDVDNNTTDEYYYAEWDRGAKTINQFYERLKALSADGSGHYVYGLPGELFRGITHEITVDTPTGTFAPVEGVSWASGTGQMLAIDSPTAGTKMWIQLLTGVAPTDGQTITGAESGATVDVNVTVTDRPISAPFVGQSTGSALIGSYGLSLQATDLTAADTVFDLTNTAITPPNYVTFTVGGLVSGEDRVLVGPWDGVSTDNEGDPAVDIDQLSLSGNLTTADVASVTVQEAIPSDTPSAGYIRVYDNNGFARRLKYTEWSGSVFTIDTAWHTANDSQNDFDSVNASDGNNVWIAYIDVEATSAQATFTSVYSANRDLVVKVRDGGGTPIKEFITSAELTGNGGSVTAIRTADT